MSEQVTNEWSKNEKLKNAVLRNFFTEQGSIKQLPSQLKKRLIVLEQLVNQLNENIKYTEKEINEFIKPMNEDFATIRRELFIHRFVNRNNDIYEVNEPGEWRDWKTLN
jgi:hypothetical protein